jgi:hypothetical protein
VHSASGAALMVLRQVELDSLARFQLGQAAVLHRSEVDEDVLASIDGNEAMSLLPAEPSHRSNHDHAPCLAGPCSPALQDPDHQNTHQEQERLRSATGGAELPLR